MKITALSGTQMMNEYRDLSEISEYPFLLIPLVPGVEEKELLELIRLSRWLDRATGTTALILLFWKSFGNSVPGKEEEEEIRQKLLANDLNNTEVKALAHGFVDEAAALAVTLGFPLSELPCIIIVDDPQSSNFYRISYKDPESFKVLTEKLVDHVRKKYPKYSECRDQKAKIEKTLSENNINKKTWKNMALKSELQSILDNTLQQVFQQYGEQHQDIASSIRYIKQNPADKTAITKLESALDRLEIASPFPEYMNSWRLLAEIATYGKPISELKARHRSLSDELKKLDRPNLGSILTKIALLEKTGDISRKSGKGLNAASSVIERVAKLAKMLELFF